MELKLWMHHVMRGGISGHRPIPPKTATQTRSKASPRADVSLKLASSQMLAARASL